MSVAILFLFAASIGIHWTIAPAKNADYQAKREMLTKSFADDLSQGVTKTDVEDYLAYRMIISFDEVYGYNSTHTYAKTPQY